MQAAFPVCRAVAKILAAAAARVGRGYRGAKTESGMLGIVGVGVGIGGALMHVEWVLAHACDDPQKSDLVLGWPQQVQCRLAWVATGDVGRGASGAKGLTYVCCGGGGGEGERGAAWRRVGVMNWSMVVLGAGVCCCLVGGWGGWVWW